MANLIDSNPKLSTIGEYSSGPIQSVVDFLSLPDILSICTTCKEYGSVLNDRSLRRRLW
jgi:hypothetical protein